MRISTFSASAIAAIVLTVQLGSPLNQRETSPLFAPRAFARAASVNAPCLRRSIMIAQNRLTNAERSIPRTYARTNFGADLWFIDISEHSAEIGSDLSASVWR